MNKIVMTLAALLLAGSTYAASLSAGTQELVVNGLFDPDTIGDSELALDVKYGQFIQDNLEIGGYGDILDNDLISRYGLGAFVEYNFDQGTEVVPFLGGSLGWGASEYDVGAEEDNKSALEIAGEGGAKYFIAENIAVSASAKFSFATDDIYAEDDELADTDVKLNLGMRFYF